MRLPEGPPTSTAWMRRPAATPPPSPSTRSRSVAPMGSSTSPGRRRWPEIPKHFIPWPRPSPFHQAAPRSDDERHREERLDIVDDGRPAPEPRLHREGRLGARHRAPPLERLHQRRLLAQHEAAGAAAHLHLHREVAAEHVAAHQPPAPRALQRALEAPRGEIGLAVHVEIDVARPRGVGGQERALEQPMRVALEEVAILEDAGLALLAVDDEVLGLARRPAGRPPTSPPRGSRRRRGPGARRPSPSRSPPRDRPPRGRPRTPRRRRGGSRRRYRPDRRRRSAR